MDGPGRTDAHRRPPRRADRLVYERFLSPVAGRIDERVGRAEVWPRAARPMRALTWGRCGCRC